MASITSSYNVFNHYDQPFTMIRSVLGILAKVSAVASIVFGGLHLFLVGFDNIAPGLLFQYAQFSIISTAMCVISSFVVQLLRHLFCKIRAVKEKEGSKTLELQIVQKELRTAKEEKLSEKQTLNGQLDPRQPRKSIEVLQQKCAEIERNVQELSYQVGRDLETIGNRLLALEQNIAGFGRSNAAGQPDLELKLLDLVQQVERLKRDRASELPDVRDDRVETLDGQVLNDMPAASECMIPSTYSLEDHPALEDPSANHNDSSDAL